MLNAFRKHSYHPVEGVLNIELLRWSQAYRAKAVRFAHVAERCSLLTIAAFGETVVALSSYTVQTSSVVYPAFVFM